MIIFVLCVAIGLGFIMGNKKASEQFFGTDKK